MADFSKWPFFKIANSRKNFVKISQIGPCMVEWMGRNFDVFPGFQQIPCYA